jgi:hypothetical protein
MKWIEKKNFRIATIRIQQKNINKLFINIFLLDSNFRIVIFFLFYFSWNQDGYAIKNQKEKLLLLFLFILLLLLLLHDWLIIQFIEIVFY